MNQGNRGLINIILDFSVVFQKVLLQYLILRNRIDHVDKVRDRETEDVSRVVGVMGRLS